MGGATRNLCRVRRGRCAHPRMIVEPRDLPLESGPTAACFHPLTSHRPPGLPSFFLPFCCRWNAANERGVVRECSPIIADAVIHSIKDLASDVHSSSSSPLSTLPQLRRHADPAWALTPMRCFPMAGPRKIRFAHSLSAAVPMSPHGAPERHPRLDEAKGRFEPF